MLKRFKKVGLCGFSGLTFKNWLFILYGCFSCWKTGIKRLNKIMLNAKIATVIAVVSSTICEIYKFCDFLIFEEHKGIVVRHTGAVVSNAVGQLS